LAVDKDSDAVDAVKEHVARAVIADCTDREALNALGVREMDGAVVAIGASLEASILTCLHLKEIGCRDITAKVVGPEHEKILSKLGVKRAVNPERESARRLAKRLFNPDVMEFIPLAQGYSVMDLAPSDELVGKSLTELQLRQKYGVQVIAVHELIPDRWHLVPDPNMKIKESDVLVVFGRDEDLRGISRHD
jgi:trk system potassium uptake protein TrkA